MHTHVKLQTHTYKSMHTGTYVYTTHTHEITHAHTQVHTTHATAHTQTHKCTHAHTCKCTHSHMCTHMYTQRHAQEHMCVHSHMYVHVCTQRDTYMNTPVRTHTHCSAELPLNAAHFALPPCCAGPSQTSALLGFPGKHLVPRSPAALSPALHSHFLSQSVP